jgi:hypothetical protein
VAARTQRNKQASVRSPKDWPLHSVGAGSTEAPVEVHEDWKKQTRNIENRARAAPFEAILQATLHDNFSPKTGDNNPKNGFDFSLLIANLPAYQAKLLEVTQANIHFALEFTQRVATTRSPFEFLAVIAEFTGRRIIMVGKHSKELAAFWRIDAFRELKALPGR